MLATRAAVRSPASAAVRVGRTTGSAERWAHQLRNYQFRNVAGELIECDVLSDIENACSHGGNECCSRVHSINGALRMMRLAAAFSPE